MQAVTGMLSAVGSEVVAVLDEIVDEFAAVATTDDGSATGSDAADADPQPPQPTDAEVPAPVPAAKEAPPPDDVRRDPHSLPDAERAMCCPASSTRGPAGPGVHPPEWHQPQQYVTYPAPRVAAASPPPRAAGSLQDASVASSRESDSGSAVELGFAQRLAVAAHHPPVGLRAPGRVQRAVKAHRRRHHRGAGLNSSHCSSRDNASSLCEWSSDMDALPAAAEVHALRQLRRDHEGLSAPGRAAFSADGASVSASGYDEAEELGFDVVRPHHDIPSK